MKKFLFVVFIFAGYILLIELVCRGWIHFRGDALQRAALVLQGDDRLGWRQKPELNTTFEKTSVITDKAGFRMNSEKNQQLSDAQILVLGPSSAFGWGVEDSETYSRILQKETGLNVFNAGQIGFGVEQGLRLWEEFIAAKNLRYVIIAYGVNDIDRYRFYGANGSSDEDFFRQPESSRLNVLERVSFPSAFINLASRAINEVRLLWPCPPQKVPELRATPERWQQKMNELAEMVSQAGATPVFLSSAFYFSRQVDESLNSKSDELYAKSARAAADGMCSDARAYFGEARSFEPYRIRRDLEIINESLKSLSSKWTVVEIHKLLDAKNDFVDPIHPSPAGHLKIARSLSPVVFK